MAIQDTVVNDSECWVCLRITPKEVLILAHKIWRENSKIAREIGLEASEIIRNCYAERPFFFCGKPRKSVLSGLFYLLGIRHNVKKSQISIADAIACSDRTIMDSWKRWYKAFPYAFTDFEIEDRFGLKILRPKLTPQLFSNPAPT